jgi:hypothetical protein
MKDKEKVAASFQKVIEAMVKQLPPEEVLRMYPPEQRLAELTPEQRLTGLTEAQTVLALPDAALRGLSSVYVATLPRAIRAAIWRRLASPARADADMFTFAPREPAHSVT